MVGDEQLNIIFDHMEKVQEAIMRFSYLNFRSRHADPYVNLEDLNKLRKQLVKGTEIVADFLNKFGDLLSKEEI
ncbi:MAG: hypothetical protein J6W09_04375 [Bacteroidales bacterium]|nr:hypothetical protein [Bacteroidales bacterium]